MYRKKKNRKCPTGSSSLSFFGHTTDRAHLHAHHDSSDVATAGAKNKKKDVRSKSKGSELSQLRAL